MQSENDGVEEDIATTSQESECDDECLEDSFVGARSETSHKNGSSYKILKQDDLWESIETISNEVSATLGSFSSSNNREAFYASVKLKWMSGKFLEVSAARAKFCGICYEDGVLRKGLVCRHYFCMDCWTEYLTLKIREGLRCALFCPDTNCRVILDDALVLQLITNATTKQLFQKHVLNNFVQATHDIKWCPGPNCENAVALGIDSSPATKIRCECSFEFCFECGEEWHSPVVCQMLKMWLKKCADDSETYNWLNANTKECPKCKAAIEKNGGCNRMLCSSCRFEFCWSCMKVWSVHGYTSSCNKFDEAEAEKANVSRAALQRYLHFYNRYTNHKHSLQLEANLAYTVERKVEFLQKEIKASYSSNPYSYNEVTFLHDALKILQECRRALMYTYALGFYLTAGQNSTQLFEDNQQDLEVATEQLSDYLERDFANEEDKNEDINELMVKVKDKSSYVAKRKETLEEQCLECVEKRTFVFDESLTGGLKFFD
ncbi:IBR domain, a half RING-finger domain-containing protein [Ditylenchus destructor]|uniref:RBR-type E3 ubiquitin transferase n=1 Tax=Ditylenchus destructor TaxID=166010 RepID=A0AAD4MXY4_9BILA|nr:IBR domain, a half RING-finger domain-containing protein [Ditylenchus destructor]